MCVLVRLWIWERTRICCAYKLRRFCTWIISVIEHILYMLPYKTALANWRTGKHEGNNLLGLVLTIKAYRIVSEYYCPSAKANPLGSKGGIRVMMPNNCGQGTRTNSFLVFSAFLHVNIWFCYCAEKTSFKHFFPFFLDTEENFSCAHQSFVAFELQSFNNPLAHYQVAVNLNFTLCPSVFMRWVIQMSFIKSTWLSFCPTSLRLINCSRR